MTHPYPPFLGPLFVLTLLITLGLWYFEWALWAWIVAGFIYLSVGCCWLSEALRVYRAKQEFLAGPPVSHHHQFVDPCDVDEFLADGHTVWEGRRRIRFAYSDFRGGRSDREVTVLQVMSAGRTSSGTYLRGYCHMRNEPRTFRVDRIKGRKVIDTATGEISTFRRLFGLRGW